MVRLKELRESKHMSQQAVADVFHVTQQTIFKYEHALAEPDLDVILHMAVPYTTVSALMPSFNAYARNVTPSA